MTLSSGQILSNRYRIVKLLGQGGFGSVYKAWDLNLERSCALKQNTETTSEAARQFFREAKILAGLSHPGLPRVTDHFTVPGEGQYLVMDYVEGDDLQAILTRMQTPLPEDQSLIWIGQICDALTYLHSQNPPVLHRDIKPANIKITPQGRAVLVDFGLAKIYDPTSPTTVGARAVTPGFSPMEQYGKGGRTDARTDIYSLAATLYMMLTATEPIESVERTLGSLLASPRELNPQISEATQHAILQGMALLPDGRFSSVEQFKTALQKPAPTDPSPLSRPEVIPPTRPPVTGSAPQPFIASLPVQLPATPPLASSMAGTPSSTDTSKATSQIPVAEQQAAPPARQRGPVTAITPYHRLPWDKALGIIILFVGVLFIVGGLIWYSALP